MESYTIKAADHYPISVHEFTPSLSNQKTIVFAAAVGVRQRFYFAMAKYLSQKGCHVFTFDYRGIGDSRSKPIRTLKDYGFFSWGGDFRAVSEYIKNKFPEHKQYMIGHSYGGNSIGFSDAYQYYDKYMTVGSQFAFYKNFSLSIQLQIKLNFKVFVPMSTALFGYYPSHIFGLGNPLPTQAAKDWATFLLHPDSMLFFAKKNKVSFYQEIKSPMLLVSIEDDPFAPSKSVDILGDQVYSAAKVTRKHLMPKEYRLKKIGHFDFFRIKNKEILWPIVEDWFDLN